MPLPAGGETLPHTGEQSKDSGIPGDRPDHPLPTLDTSFVFPSETQQVNQPTTPIEDSREFLTRLTGLQPWQLEAFPDELPPLPASAPTSPLLQTPEQPNANALSERVRFRRPTGGSPNTPRDLTLDLKNVSSPGSSPLRPTGSRHAKSHSGEFIHSREYRPLYLVERNRKSTEVEEVLPALPSSGSPSRASSIIGTEDVTEDEYQSAHESPHISLSENDVFEDTFMDAFALVSPPQPGPELQHPELADREIEELSNSQQSTPKASSFPPGVLDRPTEETVLPAEDLFAKLEQVKEEELPVSELPNEPLLSRSTEDDENLQDAMKRHSRDHSLEVVKPITTTEELDISPSKSVDDTFAVITGNRTEDSLSKSPSLLPAIALGALAGGAAAAVFDDHYSSPIAQDLGSMGSDPNQDITETTAQSIPPPEPVELDSPALARTPSSGSQEGKNDEKGSKGKSIDSSAFKSPREVTADDQQETKEANAVEAADGWFSTPAEESMPAEEPKLELVETREPEPEPESRLPARDTKGKGKNKRKGKGKKESVTSAESPAPTPIEESSEPPLPSFSQDFARTEYVPGSSSLFIPTFNDNEDEWAKNRAESAVTDDATLVGDSGASQYFGSPEAVNKEARRQKILEATAPQDDTDMEVRRAELGDSDDVVEFPGLVKKLKDIEEPAANLWPTDVPEEAGKYLPESEAVNPLDDPFVTPKSSKVTAGVVAESSLAPPSKTKKAKKMKKGKRGSQILELEPSTLPVEPPLPTEDVSLVPIMSSTKDDVEQNILNPIFDAGEASKYLIMDELTDAAPVYDAGEASQYLVTSDAPPEGPTPEDNALPSAQEQEIVPAPLPAEPISEVKPKTKVSRNEPSTSEPAQSWGKSFFGAFGWGRKAKDPPKKSSAATSNVEKSVEDLAKHSTTPIAAVTSLDSVVESLPTSEPEEKSAGPSVTTTPGLVEGDQSNEQADRLQPKMEDGMKNLEPAAELVPLLVPSENVASSQDEVSLPTDSADAISKPESHTIQNTTDTALAEEIQTEDVSTTENVDISELVDKEDQAPTSSKKKNKKAKKAKRHSSVVSETTEVERDLIPLAHLSEDAAERQQESEGGEKLDERTDILQEDIELPQKDIELPQEDIQLPQEGVELPQKDIQLPQEDVELPQEDIQLPQEGVELPREDVELPREDVELPREDVELPQGAELRTEDLPLDEPTGSAYEEQTTFSDIPVTAEAEELLSESQLVLTEEPDIPSEKMEEKSESDSIQLPTSATAILEPSRELPVDDVESPRDPDAIVGDEAPILPPRVSKTLTTDELQPFQDDAIEIGQLSSYSVGKQEGVSLTALETQGENRELPADQDNYLEKQAPATVTEPSTPLEIGQTSAVSEVDTPLRDTSPLGETLPTDAVSLQNDVLLPLEKAQEEDVSSSKKKKKRSKKGKKTQGEPSEPSTPIITESSTPSVEVVPEMPTHGSIEVSHKAESDHKMLVNEGAQETELSPDKAIEPSESAIGIPSVDEIVEASPADEDIILSPADDETPVASEKKGKKNKGKKLHVSDTGPALKSMAEPLAETTLEPSLPVQEPSMTEAQAEFPKQDDEFSMAIPSTADVEIATPNDDKSAKEKLVFVEEQFEDESARPLSKKQRKKLAKKKSVEAEASAIPEEQGVFTAPVDGIFEQPAEFPEGAKFPTDELKEPEVLAEPTQVSDLPSANQAELAISRESPQTHLEPTSLDTVVDLSVTKPEPVQAEDDLVTPSSKKQKKKKSKKSKDVDIETPITDTEIPPMDWAESQREVEPPTELIQVESSSLDDTADIKGPEDMTTENEITDDVFTPVDTQLENTASQPLSKKDKKKKKKGKTVEVESASVDATPEQKEQEPPVESRPIELMAVEGILDKAEPILALSEMAQEKAETGESADFTAGATNVSGSTEEQKDGHTDFELINSEVTNASGDEKQRSIDADPIVAPGIEEQEADPSVETSQIEPSVHVFTATLDEPVQGEPVEQTLHSSALVEDEQAMPSKRDKKKKGKKSHVAEVEPPVSQGVVKEEELEPPTESSTTTVIFDPDARPPFELDEPADTTEPLQEPVENDAPMPTSKKSKKKKGKKGKSSEPSTPPVEEVAQSPTETVEPDLTVKYDKIPSPVVILDESVREDLSPTAPAVEDKPSTVASDKEEEKSNVEKDFQGTESELPCTALESGDSAQSKPLEIAEESVLASESVTDAIAEKTEAPLQPISLSQATEDEGVLQPQAISMAETLQDNATTQPVEDDPAESSQKSKKKKKGKKGKPISGTATPITLEPQSEVAGDEYFAVPSESLGTQSTSKTDDTELGGAAYSLDTPIDPGLEEPSASVAEGSSEQREVILDAEVEKSISQDERAVPIENLHANISAPPLMEQSVVDAEQPVGTDIDDWAAAASKKGKKKKKGKKGTTIAEKPSESTPSTEEQHISNKPDPSDSQDRTLLDQTLEDRPLPQLEHLPEVPTFSSDQPAVSVQEAQPTETEQSDEVVRDTALLSTKGEQGFVTEFDPPVPATLVEEENEIPSELATLIKDKVEKITDKQSPEPFLTLTSHGSEIKKEEDTSESAPMSKKAKKKAKKKKRGSVAEESETSVPGTPLEESKELHIDQLPVTPSAAEPDQVQAMTEHLHKESKDLEVIPEAVNENPQTEPIQQEETVLPVADDLGNQTSESTPTIEKIVNDQLIQDNDQPLPLSKKERKKKAKKEKRASTILESESSTPLVTPSEEAGNPISEETLVPEPTLSEEPQQLPEIGDESATSPSKDDKEELMKAKRKSIAEELSNPTTKSEGSEPFLVGETGERLVGDVAQQEALATDTTQAESIAESSLETPLAKTETTIQLAESSTPTVAADPLDISPFDEIEGVIPMEGDIIDDDSAIPSTKKGKKSKKAKKRGSFAAVIPSVEDTAVLKETPIETMPVEQSQAESTTMLPQDDMLPRHEAISELPIESISDSLSPSLAVTTEQTAAEVDQPDEQATLDISQDTFVEHTSITTQQSNDADDNMTTIPGKKKKKGKKAKRPSITEEQVENQPEAEPLSEHITVPETGDASTIDVAETPFELLLDAVKPNETPMPQQDVETVDINTKPSTSESVGDIPTESGPNETIDVVVPGLDESVQAAGPTVDEGEVPSKPSKKGKKKGKKRKDQSGTTTPALEIAQEIRVPEMEESISVPIEEVEAFPNDLAEAPQALVGEQDKEDAEKERTKLMDEVNLPEQAPIDVPLTQSEEHQPMHPNAFLPLGLEEPSLPQPDSNQMNIDIANEPQEATGNEWDTPTFKEGTEKVTEVEKKQPDTITQVTETAQHVQHENNQPESTAPLDTSEQPPTEPSAVLGTREPVTTSLEDINKDTDVPDAAQSVSTITTVPKLEDESPPLSKKAKKKAKKNKGKASEPITPIVEEAAGPQPLEDVPPANPDAPEVPKESAEVSVPTEPCGIDADQPSIISESMNVDNTEPIAPPDVQESMPEAINTSSKKKKAKKGKKSSVATPVTETPPELVSEEQIERPEDAMAADAKPAEEPQVQNFEASAQVDFPEVTEDQSVSLAEPSQEKNVVDDWAALPSKKTKKGQSSNIIASLVESAPQEAMASASSDTLMQEETFQVNPSEPNVESVVEPMVEFSVEPTVELGGESSVEPTVEPSAEPCERPIENLTDEVEQPLTVNKEDNKRSKGPTPPIESSSGQPTESVSQTQYVHEDTVAKLEQTLSKSSNEFSVQNHPSTEQVREDMDPVEVQPGHEKDGDQEMQEQNSVYQSEFNYDDVQPTVESVAIVEDDWATPISKKKNKKVKRKSGTATPITQETVVLQSDLGSSVQQDDNVRADEDADLSVKESSELPVVKPSDPVAEPETESTLKKKGRKGRVKKQLTPLDEPESAGKATGELQELNKHDESGEAVQANYPQPTEVSSDNTSTEIQSASPVETTIAPAAGPDTVEARNNSLDDHTTSILFSSPLEVHGQPAGTKQEVSEISDTQSMYVEPVDDWSNSAPKKGMKNKKNRKAKRQSTLDVSLDSGWQSSEVPEASTSPKVDEHLPSMAVDQATVEHSSPIITLPLDTSQEVANQPIPKTLHVKNTSTSPTPTIQDTLECTAGTDLPLDQPAMQADFRQDSHKEMHPEHLQITLDRETLNEANDTHLSTSDDASTQNTLATVKSEQQAELSIFTPSSDPIPESNAIGESLSGALNNEDDWTLSSQKSKKGKMKNKKGKSNPEAAIPVTERETEMFTKTASKEVNPIIINEDPVLLRQLPLVEEQPEPSITEPEPLLETVPQISQPVHDLAEDSVNPEPLQNEVNKDDPDNEEEFPFIRSTSENKGKKGKNGHKVIEDDAKDEKAVDSETIELSSVVDLQAEDFTTIDQPRSNNAYKLQQLDPLPYTGIQDEDPVSESLYQSTEGNLYESSAIKADVKDQVNDGDPSPSHKAITEETNQHLDALGQASALDSNPTFMTPTSTSMSNVVPEPSKEEEESRFKGILIEQADDSLSIGQDAPMEIVDEVSEPLSEGPPAKQFYDYGPIQATTMPSETALQATEQTAETTNIGDIDLGAEQGNQDITSAKSRKLNKKNKKKAKKAEKTAAVETIEAGPKLNFNEQETSEQTTTGTFHDVAEPIFNLPPSSEAARIPVDGRQFRHSLEEKEDMKARQAEEKPNTNEDAVAGEMEVATASHPSISDTFGQDTTWSSHDIIVEAQAIPQDNDSHTNVPTQDLQVDNSSASTQLSKQEKGEAKTDTMVWDEPTRDIPEHNPIYTSPGVNPGSNDLAPFINQGDVTAVFDELPSPPSKSDKESKNKTLHVSSRQDELKQAQEEYRGIEPIETDPTHDLETLVTNSREMNQQEQPIPLNMQELNEYLHAETRELAKEDLTPISSKQSKKNKKKKGKMAASEILDSRTPIEKQLGAMEFQSTVDAQANNLLDTLNTTFDSSEGEKTGDQTTVEELKTIEGIVAKSGPTSAFESAEGAFVEDTGLPQAESLALSNEDMGIKVEGGTTNNSEGVILRDNSLEDNIPAPIETVEQLTNAMETDSNQLSQSAFLESAKIDEPTTKTSGDQPLPSAPPSTLNVDLPPLSVSSKPSKKRGKKHKLAAMFEPEMPEIVQVEQPKAEESAVYEPVSEGVQPIHTQVPQVPHSLSRTNSPERGVDFAATIAAGLKESGFDTDLVLNNPSFHRPTSTQGIRDVSPDDDIAAARDGASKSRFHSMGRSPSPRSPQSDAIKDAQPEIFESVVTPESKIVPSFNPMDILNDPAFSQRKSSPNILEEADPAELWSSKQKPKKGKGKKKRGTPSDMPIKTEQQPAGLEGLSETAVNNPVKPMISQAVEALPDSKVTEHALTPTNLGTDDIWVSPAEKDKKRGSVVHETLESLSVGIPMTKASTDITTRIEFQEPATIGPALPSGHLEQPLEEILAFADEKSYDDFHSVPASEMADESRDELATKDRKGKRKMDPDSSLDKTTLTKSTYEGSQDSEKIAHGDNWTSSNQKSKEKLKRKAAAVAVDVSALSALAHNDKTDTNSGNTNHLAELPPTFDQEPKSLTMSEPAEYPFPAVEISQKADDEWALPVKKAKKGKKTKHATSVVEKGIEKNVESEFLGDIGEENQLPQYDRQSDDVVDNIDTHVPRAEVSDPTAHLKDNQLLEQEDGLMTPHLDKHVTLPASHEGVKRRDHPVSPESQPEEKRVHLSDPPEATPRLDNFSLGLRTPPRASRGHSPVSEPTWSFDGIRDSAVQVADHPAILNDTQPPASANARDSGYHDASYSPRAPHGLDEGFSYEEKKLTGTPKTPRESWGFENHQEARSRSPSLPEFPSLAAVASPTAIDSATKERTSYLFNSSPSTRQYGESPTIISKSHSEDITTIGIAAAVGAAVAAGAVSSSDSHAKARHEKDSQRKRVSPTKEAKQNEGQQSIFGPYEEQTRESPSMLSTPTNKHARTPSSHLDPIKESSPDESPLHKKGRTTSDAGFPDRSTKSVRRTQSPKTFSERLKSPPPVTPTPLSRKAAPPKLDTTPPSRESPWHQVHEGVDRTMALSPARKLPHERSPPNTDPVKQRLGEHRSPSVFSDRSVKLRSPDYERPPSAASNRSATPSLRRIDRSRSGDLRFAAKLGEVSAPDAKRAQSTVSGIALAAGATAAVAAAAAGIASSSKYDPVKDKGKGRADMPDVYEAWGEAQGSPMSPTRPPSVRKRQSMQIMDLQSQLENLAAQNRSLEEARLKAEETLQQATYQREVDQQVVTEAVQARDRELHQKDIDIGQLRDTLQRLQEEIARLTELNNALSEANRNLTNDANARYAQLQAEGQAVQDQWHQSSRELEDLRTQHSQLTNGMQAAIASEIGAAIDERNAEIDRLNQELASAREQIQVLQKQILDSKKPNESFLTVRDEDYFDSACQQLCQHVQQWVLRFSKFSDNRACRLSSEIAADTRLDTATRQKIDTRLDNAILDGSDVDALLADRVKRRDVFMSVVMTMIWEYVFTRYLFGMDREQRQKLKSLEKTLFEVGK